MNFTDKICLQLVGSHYIMLNSAEVIYLEADRQVCHVNLLNGSRQTAARHLGYYKSGLIQHFHFLEVSKSMLINPLHLLRYSPRDRSIQLSMGHSIPVAKTRQEALNKMFKQMHDQWKADFMEEEEVQVPARSKEVEFLADLKNDILPFPSCISFNFP